MIASGIYPHWPKVPAIENEHLIVDARVFANRKSLIASLPVPRGGKVAEIGVWQGTFSTFLIEQLRPRRLFAFDIFTGHECDEWNGYSGNQLFEGLTHRQFFEQAMAPFGDVTVIVEGPSETTLGDYTDRSFDLVYVDGGHDYDTVKADADLAVEMVSETGFLLFNDYIMLDPGKGDIYGIVPVVNDLVVHGPWRVVGYALNEHLFCDIALCRSDHPMVRPTAQHAPVAEPPNVHPTEQDAPVAEHPMVHPTEQHAPVAEPAEQRASVTIRQIARLLYRGVRHPRRAMRWLSQLANGR